MIRYFTLCMTLTFDLLTLKVCGTSSVSWSKSVTKFERNRAIPGWIIRPTDVSREGLKFYPWTFFYFFINPPRSASAQWTAIKCILEVSSWAKLQRLIRRSPHASPNFYRGEKVQNMASFSTSLKLALLAFDNAARYPNAETNFLCGNDRPMSSLSFV